MHYGESSFRLWIHIYILRYYTLWYNIKTASRYKAREGGIDLILRALYSSTIRTTYKFVEILSKLGVNSHNKLA